MMLLMMHLKIRLKKKPSAEDIANAIKADEKEDKTPKDESVAEVLGKGKKRRKC